MKTILFQGDSITDVDRSRNNDRMLGHGYPTVVAAMLGQKYPGAYKFINKGISGNRIVDVYARIRRDILNLEPDVMSLLIGVNDVWHDFENNGVDAEKFEKIYDMLVEELLEKRPEMKIIVMEPFVLHGGATNGCYDDFFRPEVELRAAASRRVAERHGLIFLPLQEMFDKAYPTQPEGYWLSDGVHPSVEGHGLITCAWIKCFEENCI